MGSLSGCAKRYKVDPADQAEIRELAKGYRDDGHSGPDSIKLVVKDQLKQMHEEREQIVAQIRSAVGEAEVQEPEEKRTGGKTTTSTPTVTGKDDTASLPTDSSRGLIVGNVPADVNTKLVDKEADVKSKTESDAELQRETKKGVALFARDGEEKRASILSDVEFDAVLKRVTARLDAAERARRFEVVPSFEDLPAAIRKEAHKQGEQGSGVSGVYHRGKVYLVRDTFSSEKWLEEVIFHEWHGHLGLNGLFGPDMMQSMLEIHRAIGSGKLLAIGKKHGIDLMRYGQGLTRAGYDEDTKRAIMTEEMLAHLTDYYSEGPVAAKIREIIGQVRAWLREHGFLKLAELGETDLAWLLKRARTYAEAGVGNPEGGTVFAGAEDLLRRLAEKGIGEADLKRALAAVPTFATAWHGSPYDFESFSTDHIGTGEGAQAYGYGLYFAGNKAVAEHYRDVLSRRSAPIISKDGRSLSRLESLAAYFKPGRVVDGYGGKDKVIEFKLSDNGWQWGVKVVQVKNDGSEKPGERARVHSTEPESSKLAKVLAAEGYDVQQGRLYHVELAPEEDEYLLWDRPLTEQSEKVKGLLDKSMEAEGTSLDAHETLTGAELYRMIAENVSENDYDYVFGRSYSNDKTASEHLHSLGIRGIKYLDGSSRGQEGGNHNYVVFDDQDVEVTARFALREAAALLEPVAEYAKTNWKTLLNPLDWSRTVQFFDDWTPTAIKSGIGYVLANPHFEAERDQTKAPLVREGADREVNRMELMLKFFGYTPGQEDTRTKLQQFKEFFTKWHSGQESTAWEGLNQRYAKLGKVQTAAINILAAQGDVNNVHYTSYQNALKNPKVKAAGLSQETFDLYKDVHDHMERVSELRAAFTKEMMERAGVSKKQIEEHISKYRQEVREVSGWLSRNHGQGEFATNVYHVIEDLPFTLRDIKGEAQQAFLPFYPGNAALAAIKKLAGDATVTLTGKGQVVVTAKEGQDLAGFMAGVSGIIPDIGKQRVKVYAKYQTMKGAARHHVSEVKANLKAHIPENFIEGAKYEVTDQQVEVLTEEIYQNMKSDMAMEAGLQKSFDRAFKSGELSKEELDTLHDQLIQDTAEVLLGRAAGKYQIRRAPYLIEGYDTSNLMGNYQDYMTSVAGMLSKADYARKQFENLKKTPVQTKQWAYKYVFDSLRNMGLGDRISGNLRAFVSLWYMGLKPATALINATQVYTLGVAEIGKISKGSAVMIIGKAQKDILAGKLSVDEQAVFNSAIVKQQEAASAMAQITGHNEGSTGKASRVLHGVTGKTMALFQNIEIMNRKTMILAAYRTLRSPKTAAGIIDEKALHKALDINNNTNFDQGRHNLPGWARGPIGHTAYALQSFTWNNFNWLYNNLTSGEKQDQIALLRYAGMLMLIGGIGALAGGDELDKLYLKLRGRSLMMEAKEWTRKNAKNYGTLGEMANAFAWNGLGGVAGVNISNSMRLQVPVVSQMIGDASMPEAFAGVWAGLFKKAWLSTTALSHGDIYRAAESAAPESIAGGMRAYRQYDQGMTTLKGKPIFDEHGKPLKYSATDAALRMAGFQPAEQSRRMEVSQKGKDLQAWWKEQRENLLIRLRLAKTAEERRQVSQDIMRFNRDLRQSQAFGLVKIVKAETMRTALTAKPDKSKMKWSQAALGD